ncbi:FAD-dependent oxidoreductase [Limisalsivibrio acetivorans]|uniref:FAD-dependent oxidoreductase n=1 Tax=Limisalsivibrio acetivorans TaxID=1304888 RepID=UPI0003B56341|nr:FAD-dependent oxidoreductase [Limisalsivibrio acetivorans]
MKIVVLGGGPGGIQFTKTVKSMKPEADITMIRPEPYSVVYCALPYVIEDIVKRESIRKKNEMVTDTGAKLVLDKALSVDFGKRSVITEKNGEFSYDKLVIATGASPFIPPVCEGSFNNVFTVKTEEDLDHILGALKDTTRKALVVGAGNIGIEMAAAFRQKGLETVLAEMQEWVLPNLLDQDMAELPAQEIREMGTDLRLGTAVKTVQGERHARRAVFSNGDVMELGEDDLVIFSVGVKPNVEIFADSTLEMDSFGIITDSRMHTNIEDVYAVGDCASFFSFIDQKPVGGKLATNAVPMGKIAAYDLLGLDLEYPGFVNGAITKSGNWRMGGTGFTEEEAKKRGFITITAKGETTTRFPMMPGAKRVFVKLVADADSGRIIGGQVVGGEGVPGRVDTITLAIQQRMTAKELFLFSYSAQPYQSFFPASNAIVQAAEKIMLTLKENNLLKV